MFDWLSQWIILTFVIQIIIIIIINIIIIIIIIILTFNFNIIYVMLTHFNDEFMPWIFSFHITLDTIYLGYNTIACHNNNNVSYD